MKKQELEAWERFCKTGAVGDYLDYRTSVGFSRKADIMTEVESGAAISGCGGYTRETAGGAGPTSDPVNP